VPKDFTDFVVLIFDSGDRLYHIQHLRHNKKVDIDMKTLPHKGHKYLLELDRAYRIKWKPWPYLVKRKWEIIQTKKGIEKKVIRSRVSIPKTISEVFRSKKIGLLLYQEPPPPREVLVVTDLKCSCGFKGETMRGTKIHSSNKKSPEHELVETVSKELVGVVTKPISPMHISRIHQPSGVMKG